MPDLSPNHSIDILIAASVDANELTGLLNEPGLLGTWVKDHTIHVYWDPAHWSTQVHASILSALRTLGMPHPEDVIGIRDLPSQDWNAQWARQVTPIRIGQHVRIRPSWEPASTNPQDIDLIIDPKQAFGTGHHATTQLLTEWLETVIEGGETLLDIGTGTGILAMVAIRLGAKRALGVDCDAQAIDCAREYGCANGFGEELGFRVATLEQCPPSSWDVIVANVDRRTLLGIAEQMHSFLSPGGQLFLSGLLVEDREEISEAFARHGWRVLESRIKNEWLALQLTHQSKP
ncbi:MAG: 50S ribosomal protein L11 methyltransferase [Nitrospirae bacterium]|nr:50S ribosomal protein L11 methyltransferase [Nitrospirota bacterium]MDA1304656.1 50S ribosomal protein L11 methyltransferase [Nitrospirota bacterium]